MKRSITGLSHRRRGVIAVLAAALFIVMLAMVAFAVDVGYVAMAKTQLQAAADAAALAAAGSSNLSRAGMLQTAQAFAQYHKVGARPVILNAGDVQFGIWDVNTRTFSPMSSSDLATAVKVTVRADDSSGGNVPIFFGRVLGGNSVAMQASAVAMANPRDIAFVVDLSGSMTFDTTPGQSSASATLIQQVYDDFGFGTYPGTLASRASISNVNNDTQFAAWMNGQLKTVMPNAVPTPDGSSADSRTYWRQYYNNAPSGKIGYKSYLQFIMNKGRDNPVVTEIRNSQGVVTRQAQYSPLSMQSSSCPMHAEMTDGGTFMFPPREMPTHAVRRALIAALAVIQERNASITDPSQQDRVSLIVFDMKNTSGDQTHVRVACPLTNNYASVMEVCRTLQACRSDVSCTNSEGGIILGANHIKPVSQGGQGRENSNKVMVFLTDGNPNLYESSSTTINNFKNSHPDASWGSSYAENGALMQSVKAATANASLYAVGVGLGGNQAFMDRMARNAGTAKNDAAYPIADNSATYEATLKSIFQGIISNPKLRLVQ